MSKTYQKRRSDSDADERPRSRRRPVSAQSRRISREESFEEFRLAVHHQLSDSQADRGERLELNRTERQRYDCPEHGAVVPLSDRFGCPYCLPVGEDEPSFAVTVGGRVVLNPS